MRTHHQEDFNQVLGASANQKYQELGGVVSLARVAGALSQYAGSEDVLRLAQTTCERGGPSETVEHPPQASEASATASTPPARGRPSPARLRGRGTFPRLWIFWISIVSPGWLLDFENFSRALQSAQPL